MKQLEELLAIAQEDINSARPNWWWEQKILEALFDARNDSIINKLTKASEVSNKALETFVPPLFKVIDPKR